MGGKIMFKAVTIGRCDGAIEPEQISVFCLLVANTQIDAQIRITEARFTTRSAIPDSFSGFLEVPNNSSSTGVASFLVNGSKKDGGVFELRSTYEAWYALCQSMTQ